MLTTALASGDSNNSFGLGTALFPYDFMGERSQVIGYSITLGFYLLN